ncbi:hypothetical protein EON65_47335 [archaeon]|nr:MAG: hypothetical protein EON65_47335 [archaeon]
MVATLASLYTQLLFYSLFHSLYTPTTTSTIVVINNIVITITISYMGTICVADVVKWRSIIFIRRPHINMVLKWVWEFEL